MTDLRPRIQHGRGEMPGPVGRAGCAGNECLFTKCGNDPAIRSRFAVERVALDRKRRPRLMHQLRYGAISEISNEEPLR